MWEHKGKNRNSRFPQAWNECGLPSRKPEISDPPDHEVALLARLLDSRPNVFANVDVGLADWKRRRLQMFKKLTVLIQWLEMWRMLAMRLQATETTALFGACGTPNRCCVLRSFVLLCAIANIDLPLSNVDVEEANAD